MGDGTVGLFTYIANFWIRAFNRKLARMVSDLSGATFLCSANL